MNSQSILSIKPSDHNIMMSNKILCSTFVISYRCAVYMMLVFILTSWFIACDSDDPASDSLPEPPVVTETIEDQQIKADEELEFDLNQFFEHPENEPMDFQGTSSDPKVVEVTVNASTLAIEPTGGGEVIVTVVAESEGGSAEMSFHVEVTLPEPPGRPD